eukprot:scaffold88_cov223-Pinguiococcus_pyrenoidosus.AAC.2
MNSILRKWRKQALLELSGHVGLEAKPHQSAPKLRSALLAAIKAATSTMRAQVDAFMAQRGHECLPLEQASPEFDVSK